MKTVSKKLLCLLMAVFLLAAAIPFQALAAETPAADTPTKYELSLILKDKDGNQLGEKQTFQKADGEKVGILGAFQKHFKDELAKEYESLTFTANDAPIGNEMTITGNTEVIGTVTFKATTPSPDPAPDPDPDPAPVAANVSIKAYLGSELAGTYTLTGKNVGDQITQADVTSVVETNYPHAGYTLNFEPFTTVTADANTTVEVRFTRTAQTVSVTFDYNGGTLNNASSATVSNVAYGTGLESLSQNPTRAGYVFIGWFTEKDGGTQVQKVDFTENKTVYAHWSQETSKLVVYLLYNKDTTNAKIIYSQPVAKGEKVLSHLNNNVKAIVRQQLASAPGYHWDGDDGDVGYWLDYAMNKLTPQDVTMGESYTAYVNFTPNTYTIHFDANGGKVSPTSKKVTFGQKIDSLPTPTKDKSVFAGWIDGEGKAYKAGDIYKVAGDITLYAQWKDEAFVLVRFYLNGDTSSVHRIMDMTQYVEDDCITREAVEKIVKKFYHAQSGKELRADGLYTVDTWKDYVKNTSKKGVPSIQIKTDKPTYIYVMVRNAAEGGSSTTSTTKPVDKTNPKTGDTMLIYPAAAVMVLAAAALVTAQVVRKKKEF